MTSLVLGVAGGLEIELRFTLNTAIGGYVDTVKKDSPSPPDVEAPA